ncbi:MAG: class I SAM-dependent methyltransferase [Gammaproteobacteria bacterium]|nr:class I SAM-dependent methyltransferase [Gammaproteobacteria bacterium]
MKKTELLTWEQAVSVFRENPDNRDAVFACYYDDPLRDAAERYTNSAEWKELSTYLPSRPGKMLDLGAGRGISSYAFAKLGWDVTALEPDPSDIIGNKAIQQLASQTNLSLSIIDECGEYLPCADERFDVVHGRAVLHHAKDLNLFCMEAARVLRPGGLLIAIREHVISKQQDREVFLKEHPLHHMYGGENAFTRDDYRSAIVNAGLQIETELNPWASEINLHPDTFESFQSRLKQQLRVPQAIPVPRKLLSLFGCFYRKPGRLYSFFARKKDIH